MVEVTEITKKNHISVKRFIKESKERANKSGKTDLKFTWGWVNSFFKRNGFKLRKPTSKASRPEDFTEVVQNYTRKIAALVSSGSMILIMSLMLMRPQ